MSVFAVGILVTSKFVLVPHWNECGNASRQLRTMWALRDGSIFLIQCVAYDSDIWITCTSGRDARFYPY